MAPEELLRFPLRLAIQLRSMVLKCTSEFTLMKIILFQSFQNSQFGRVHACLVIPRLQREVEAHALASTVYSVAASSFVSEHERGLMEAAISHDLPPPDTWYNVTPELILFGVTVTVRVDGDVDATEISWGSKCE